ncbi:DUF6434 domain-containing protein [Xanthomonas sacchari]
MSWRIHHGCRLACTFREDQATRMRDTHEDPSSASGHMRFDWHSDPITRATPVDEHYRNTQNVRRFLVTMCGDGFAFDRAFIAWIRNGVAKTMGDVADEWRRRHIGTVPT